MPSETYPSLPGDATGQREQAMMTPHGAPDQALTEGAGERSTQKRTERGRPPKNRAKPPLVGASSDIEVLLRTRYYSIGDRIANGRSNQDAKGNWAMLAAAVGRQICADIDVEQCRNKLKHLERLWHACNNDRRATRNVSSPVEPPCI
ncbi:hypothetical protein PR003_g25962 [Phytophthora rubi]|uniref:Myb/SANT-like domain-containing protein n=1 Tax=Phytophthora rubi TaxID=129364 RepID=A0A6A4CB17_9STRA|nr:hypothetical protein PR002_g25295 [Phytophthora rubi]KAE8977988.1 hypothetical protein PR001_g24971 [Phytophthora rubi]KAE9287811.1 hypothetical protein PR003_g25962 [Phytophthora rubi]